MWRGDTGRAERRESVADMQGVHSRRWLGGMGRHWLRPRVLDLESPRLSDCKKLRCHAYGICMNRTARPIRDIKRSLRAPCEETAHMGAPLGVDTGTHTDATARCAVLSGHATPQLGRIDRLTAS